MFNDHSNGADSSAQRKRANVTHEDLGRMRVIPEKADTGPDHGAAEDRQLGGLRHALEFQIFGKHGVSAEIGQYRESSGGGHGAAAGQTLQPVGEGHGVARE